MRSCLPVVVCLVGFLGWWGESFAMMPTTPTTPTTPTPSTPTTSTTSIKSPINLDFLTNNLSQGASLFHSAGQPSVRPRIDLPLTIDTGSPRALTFSSERKPVEDRAVFQQLCKALEQTEKLQSVVVQVEEATGSISQGSLDDEFRKLIEARYKEPAQQKTTATSQRTWGDIPEAQKFEDMAEKDWKKLNQRIAEVRELIENNKKSRKAIAQKRDDLAKAAGQQAQKDKSQFIKESITEGGGAGLSYAGTKALGKGAKKIAEKIPEAVKDNAVSGGLGLLDSWGKSIGDVLTTAVQIPTSLLVYVGEGMDKYQRAKTAIAKIEQLDNISVGLRKLHSSLEDHYNQLLDQKEALAKKIEETQNKMWSTDPQTRQDALTEYEKTHEKNERYVAYLPLTAQGISENGNEILVYGIRK